MSQYGEENYGYAAAPQQQQQQPQGYAQQQQVQAQAPVQGYQTGGNLPDDCHLSVEDFDKHTYRKYYFMITGSYAQFKAGTASPVWRAEPGNEHIYQRIDSVVNGNPVYKGDLTKMLILGAELDWAKGTYPDALGVNITGIQGTTYPGTGRSYAFVVPSRSKVENQNIFKPKENVTVKMLSKYNSTSSAKLQSHIYKQEGSDLTLVDNVSPIATMLRINQDVLSLRIGLPAEKAGYLTVPSKIVDACVERYEADHKIQFVDGNNLELDMERVNSPDDWTSSKGISDNLRSYKKGSAAHVSSQRLSNIYKLEGVVTLKTVLYGNEKK